MESKHGMLARNEDGMKPARTRGHKNPDESRGTKSDATEAVVPSGHDGARQALSELRRMIDPHWHRFGSILSRRHDVAHTRRNLKPNHAITAYHHTR